MPSVAYAKFWQRALAIVIDYFAMYIVWLPLGLIALFILGDNPGERDLIAFIAIASVLGTWLYSAVLESSRNQATLGKRALGLRVTDLDGGRISFWVATKRYFGKLLSVLSLLIGFIMSAFGDRHQALHDRLAGTLVLKN